ncbi:hypothetical protein AVEN_37750-1 [Araneus ventricosus]|uniref:Uncharacterized protein n=1 Tax=Araneus ventricosus TaxID=182803 RepID=A0A4Y2BSW1_ARAVE|nr:hypothetical protein AVEN_37750-1 [Araneus ventricosus]
MVEEVCGWESVWVNQEGETGFESEGRRRSSLFGRLPVGVVGAVRPVNDHQILWPQNGNGLLRIPPNGWNRSMMAHCVNWKCNTSIASVSSRLWGPQRPPIPTRPSDQTPSELAESERRKESDVVKTILDYITRRVLQGPCRLTIERSPKLTDKRN